MMQRCKVYFDGGCRPNPGPIEAAVVIRGKVHLLDGLGSGSSQDAEWLALIGAARLVRELGLAPGLGLGPYTLVGDSREVIAAAAAALRTGRAAAGHCRQFLSLIDDPQTVRLRWVKRAHNLAGIALARRHPR